MSRRYYLCDVIGDGTFENPYRSAAAAYGLSYVSDIPVDTMGHPTSPWTLTLVNALNHAALLSDSRISALPDFPLDGKISAINNATKNAMIARMRARGIDTSFVDKSDGYRDVIRALGLTLNPNFNENNFDVSD